MEKSTLYKITIGALIALNLVLVAFLWFGRPNAGQSPLRAIELLELDKGQTDRFFESIEAHQLEMRRIDGEQREMLREYFSTLKVPANNSSIPVPPQVLSLEEQKIQVTYDHFLAVKGILNPDQLAEYPEFIDFVIERVVKKMQNKPTPRRIEEEPPSNR